MVMFVPDLAFTLTAVESPPKKWGEKDAIRDFLDLNKDPLKIFLKLKFIQTNEILADSQMHFFVLFCEATNFTLNNSIRKRYSSFP